MLPRPADRPDAGQRLDPSSAAPATAAQPAGRLLGRRAVLLGGTAAVLLAATACTPTTPAGPRTVTKTVAAPPPADPMAGLVAVTRLHTLRLASAMTALAKDKTRLPVVTALHADRQAHLTRLIAEWKRTDPTEAARAADLDATPISVGTDATAIYGALRSDATTAQQQFTDSLLTETAYRAALFGSIVACLASHRTVLS